MEMTTMDDTDSHERLGDDRGRRLRRTLVAAGAGLGMMLAGLGIATAQTGGSGPPTTTTVPADGERRPGRHHGVKVSLAVAANAIGIGEDELRTALRSGQSIAQVARSRNVDVQKVIDAIVADARQRIAEKVQSGDLTQAQADERLANLTQRVTDMVNRTGGFRHGPGRHGRHGPGPGLAAAATAIGIGEDELRTALRSGQSIAQVAQSRNVDVQKVIDAIVAGARQRIAEKVQSGDLTQAQADERVANLTQRVTDMVNRTRRPGHRGGG